ncbi:unnamed protein product [Oncorhynchus mykiss]|uniref:Uncharacterized protein n=1 Tax=Oncorhynchus mykiss TaxID=8022 RepID=A0A061AF70_ONCMY|nr:unnamed protein product [Oncorhynchus mykiss]
MNSFIHPFIHPSIHPFIHPFIHSFIHSSIHSSIQANERLSQANLDAIAFPTLLQTVTLGTMSPEAQVHPEVRRSPTEHLQQAMAQGQNQGSLDTSTSEEETLKDFPRQKEGPCPQASAVTPKTNPPLVLPKASPPPPLFKTSHRPHTLLSLRISESTLQETSPLQVAPHLASPTVSLQDYDEVFLQEPAPPSPIPPPLPIRETDITEYFPPPPPPLLPPSSLPDREEKEEENHRGPGLQHLNSCEFPFLPSSYRQTVPPSVPLSVSPRPSLTPEPQPETPTTLSSSFPEPQQGPSGEESLGQEYHLPARREKSAGELRVEALARQLVSRGDKSLTPMLDSWAEGGRTMDLMEEIFPAGGGGCCGNAAGPAPVWRTGEGRRGARGGKGGKGFREVWLSRGNEECVCVRVRSCIRVCVCLIHVM